MLDSVLSLFTEVTLDGFPLWVVLLICAGVFLASFMDAIAGGGGIISVPVYLMAFSGLPTYYVLGTNKLSAGIEKFDLVILDPPAFTKSRASVKKAVTGYREINLRGIKLVKNGGYLATCSCSHFMTPELFTKTIGEAARDARRRLRQVEYRTQSPDRQETEL